MTTTPETIAELKRLLAIAAFEPWQATYVKAYEVEIGLPFCVESGAFSDKDDAALAVAAVNALPSLLSDLEDAQKREQVLREALTGVASAAEAECLDGLVRCLWIAERAKTALAATEAK